MDLSEERIRFRQDGERHFWELARADFLVRLLGRRLPPGPGTILDIGCGDGYLLRRLGAAFPERRFAAVDPAAGPERTAELEALLPGRVSVSTGVNPQSAAAADTVTLFDVLEHIEDDAAFLRSVRDMVPAGTLFFLTVPAGARLFGEHDRKLRHFRRYDHGALRLLLERSGLRILETGSFFQTLYWFRCLELLFGRRSPGVGGGAISPRWLNVCLRNFLRLEAGFETRQAWSRLRLPGLPLEAICRK